MKNLQCLHGFSIAIMNYCKTLERFVTSVGSIPGMFLSDTLRGFTNPER